MNKKKLLINNLKLHAVISKNDNTGKPSVHHTLLERAFDILSANFKTQADIISPMMKYMLHVVKKPDTNGDYEKGTGRHYYSSLNRFGKPVKPICGYYKNGIGHFGKSARSMFEENYTMALTMFHAGELMQASSYLGRAVHMLSDICCLPHALGMTYFSSNGKIHHAYEDLAFSIYPDIIPSQSVTPAKLNYFSDRDSFAHALNSIVEGIRYELSLLYSDPEREVIARIYDSEVKVAALLKRFADDTLLSPEKANYIADDMLCSPFSCYSVPLTVKVTPKGIMLFFKGVRVVRTVNGTGCKYFSAAHRRDGFFTLSPARCSEDIVFTDNAYSSFDPKKSNQLIRFSYNKK